MIFIVGLLAIIAVGLVHPLGLHAPSPARRCSRPTGCRPSRCCSC